MNRVAVGFFNTEGGGMCGTVNNSAIPGVDNAGAAIVDDGIAAAHSVRTGA